MLKTSIGPNRSICNNSKGLEVETKFFDLKEFLAYFPNWHASQILSLLKDNLGSPITKSFLTSLLSVFMLACPNLLCHNQLSFIVKLNFFNVNNIYIFMPFTNVWNFVSVWINNVACMCIKTYSKAFITKLTNT